MSSNPIVDEVLLQVKDEIMKAETGANYTFSPATRSVFSPENMDEKMKFLVPIDTPLRNRLPRTQGKGMFAEWKRLTSALHSKSHPSTNAASGTGTAITFADAAAPGETTQTYDAKSAQYKLFGRKLEIGGLMLAASKGLPGGDMQAKREMAKMYEVMLGEEEVIIAGDVTNSAYEFDGLFHDITTNSGNATFLTASGVGNYCRTIYARGGDPTLLLASALQLEALKDDLQASGSIAHRVIAKDEVAGVTGGLALARIVNPVTQSLIDVKPSRFVGYSALLLTEKSPAGETWIEMEDLIPMSRVDVPSTSFSYTSFILEATVLKLLGEPFQEKITVGA